MVQSKLLGPGSAVAGSASSLACQRTAEQPPQTQPRARRSRGTLWEQAFRSRKGRKAAPKIYQTLKNTG